MRPTFRFMETFWSYRFGYKMEIVLPPLIVVVVITLIIHAVWFKEPTEYRKWEVAEQMMEINKRLVFYNVRTGNHIILIEGRCSVIEFNHGFDITIRIGENSFKRHFVAKTRDILLFKEEIGLADEEDYRYKIEFKPKTTNSVLKKGKTKW